MIIIIDIHHTYTCCVYSQLIELSKEHSSCSVSSAIFAVMFDSSLQMHKKMKTVQFTGRKLVCTCGDIVMDNIAYTITTVIELR